MPQNSHHHHFDEEGIDYHPPAVRESNITIINRQHQLPSESTDTHQFDSEELIIEEEEQNNYQHHQTTNNHHHQEASFNNNNEMEEEYMNEPQQTITESRIQRWRRNPIIDYLLKLWEIASTMIPLSLLSFGGPAAHISIIQENFVTRRQWVTIEQFSELFAVCQSLPGPTSTQLVIAIGTLHAGYLGGLLSFLFFSVPTAMIMGSAGILLKDQNVTNLFPYYLTVALNGFSCAAVSIVLHAAYTMASRLTTDKMSKSLLIGAFAVFIIWQKWYTVLIVMFCGGFINLVFEYTQIFYQRTIKEHGMRRPKGVFASIKFFAIVLFKNVKEFKQFIGEKLSWVKRRNNRNNASSGSGSGAGGLRGSGSFELEEVQEGDSEPRLLGNEEDDDDDLESNPSKEEEGNQEGNNDDELPSQTPPVAVAAAAENATVKLPLHMRPFMGIIFLSTFFILLFGLFIARISVKYPPLEWAEGFFRIGSLIFGGGHVVLPMIVNEFSELGYLTEESFLNGFALQSALPGPMFNISAYVGGIMGGVIGAVISWVALFTPALLFVWGALPFWHKYREKQVVKSILKGVNATSVGFVFTAVYILWLGSVPNLHTASACTVVFSVLMLSVYDIPAPIVILIAGGIRILLDFTVVKQ